MRVRHKKSGRVAIHDAARLPRTTDSGQRTKKGFTLIELGVVVLIIGLIVTFILISAMGAVENSRLRATQALIVKLEIGLNERMSALTSVSPTVNGAHQFLASINPQGNPPGAPPLPWGLPSGQRAEVIARFDQMRMEVPDVFYIQDYDPTGGNGTDLYPINFAGLPYDPANTGNTSVAPYMLPLGHVMPPGYSPGPGTPPLASSPDPFSGPGAGQPPGTAKGIYGASYTARAALHKLIGLDPRGCDSADNDGNFLVDEFGECVPDGPNGSSNAAQAWRRFRDNHNHNTARSEMLFALLVEGGGPAGSVFGKEEFKQGVDYADTDGDGLNEFIDGWGKPLQFYRWPIYYFSESVQGGPAAYGTTFQPREAHPLDPNNQLIAPGWWGDLSDNSPPINPSAKALYFQRHFTSLIDPNYGQATTTQANYWDRTGAYPRRAFACKFLIVSSGPDQELGLYQLTNDFVRQTGGGSQPDTVAQMLVGNPLPVSNGDYGPTQFGENWAATYYDTDEGPNPAAYNGYPMQRAINAMTADGVTLAGPKATLDNIDNHNLQNQSGGLR